MSVGTYLRWSLRHGVPRVMFAAARLRSGRGSGLQGGATRWTDPYPHYDLVRAQGPLARDGLTIATAHHDVVSSVLRSGGVWQMGIEVGDPPAWLRLLLRLSRNEPTDTPIDPPSLLAVNPPVHTRYRRMVAKVFTARAIEQLRDGVQQNADDLLDRLEGRPAVDLVDTYASYLPLTVIADILGIPPEMHDRVLHWGRATAACFDIGMPLGQYRELEQAQREAKQWLHSHFDHLRRNPGDNLLSKLVAVLDDDGQQLTEAELTAVVWLVIAAGFETTVHLLSSGTKLLLDHPDERAILRDDPSLWPNAVDEILRCESPIQQTSRTAAMETELAGRTYPRGTMVGLMIAGANRDPAVFTDPDRFDVRRHNAHQHLAFSAGLHHCIGSALARLEGEIGLRTLFERFPDLGPAGTPTRRPTRVLRGYATLPLTLGERHDAPVAAGCPVAHGG